MRATSEELIVLGEEDSSSTTQEHTHAVARDTCQGLQCPNILDYWLDLFSSLQVCNGKPCDLLGAACKKNWGKNNKTKCIKKKSSLCFKKALYSLPFRD